MPDQSYRKGLRATPLLVALALLCAQRGQAADVVASPATSDPQAQACSVPAPAAAPVAAPEATAGGAGMWAFIDPQTGRLTSTPTDEQREALRQAVAAMINESSEGLVAVRHADGRLSMDLQGRFMNVAIATLQPSGQTSFACTNRVDDAVKIMTIPAVPTVDGLETE